MHPAGHWTPPKHALNCQASGLYSCGFSIYNSFPPFTHPNPTHSSGPNSNTTSSLKPPQTPSQKRCLLLHILKVLWMDLISGRTGLYLVSLCLSPPRSHLRPNPETQALSSGLPRAALFSSNGASSKKPSLNHLAKANPLFDHYCCTLYFPFHSP